ncbi:Ribonuclease BN [uncultured Leptolyngbya sp.]|uniref:Ribonuclease BN n=1 Tax=uncultured Leptolyngbya sp. TaxID=332963 RepID=A0A6J4LWH7_9CYAN|nr:Ribonuclease BN [uncultured Leptolyngbya sp.]
MLKGRFFRFFHHLTPATVREIIDRVGQRRLPGLASEMAYNAMLALFPGILAILTAISLFGGSEKSLNNLVEQVGQVAPEEALMLIQNFIGQIGYQRNQGLFSVSFLISLWAASSVLGSAMVALDQIYQVPPQQRRPFWKTKLVSLALTIGTIQLVIVASVLVFISDFIVQVVAYRSGAMEPGVFALWRLFTWPLALIIIALASAFIYRFGPSRWTVGTPILPGAILAAIFWAVLSGLFRFYVAHFGSYNRAYGVIGAVIVLLLWLYLSSLVMLIGAQLNVTVGAAMQRRSRRKT